MKSKLPTFSFMGHVVFLVSYLRNLALSKATKVCSTFSSGSFIVLGFTLRSLIYFVYLFIYLSTAVLGLRCCARAFSSCGERGLLLDAVCGLLVAVASPVSEHSL